MATEQGLSFVVTVDNSNFVRGMQKVQSSVKEASKRMSDEGVKMESVMAKLTKAAAGMGAAFSVKEIVSQIVKVRGEYQGLEVAFKTMLQSEEEAVKLMDQLTRTAATTPFGLNEVANGAKQLLAYGKSASEVNDTLIKLGDIASGLSIPLGDLIYLYGTTMTQGRLYTQDLNQFTGRGIPMIKELAKQFGVAESKVKELVEQGKVGFPEVEKVIDSLTAKGSMFGGLMADKSKTIAGQISNLQDSIEMMFNELGKSQEGLISDSLNVISKLVENYQQVGKTIVELVGVYGVYKAALITITALEKAHAVVVARAQVEMLRAAKAGKALSDAQAMAAAKAKVLQVAQMGLVRSLKAMTAAMTSNPYVLLAAGIAAAAYGIYKFATRATAAEKAVKSHNERAKEMSDRYEELTSKTNDYDSVVRDNTKTELQRIEAYKKLQAIYPDLLKNMELEKYLLIDSVDASKMMAKAVEERKITEQRQIVNNLEDEMQKNQNRIKQIEKKSWTDTSVSEWYELSRLRERNEQLKLEYDQAVQIVWDGLKARAQAESMANKQEKTSSYTKELKKATEQAAKLNKEIAELRSGKPIELKEGESIADRIEAKQKELKAVKDTIATLTGKTEKEQTKSTEEEAKRQRELNGEIQSLLSERTQLEISLMKEGAAKKEAEIEAEYDNEITKIRQKEQEWKDEQKGGLTQGQSDYVTEALRQATDKRLKLLNQLNEETAKAERDAYTEYLAQYGEYAEKRMAIEERYRQRMADAETDGERLSLQKEMEKAIADLDYKQFEKSIEWDKIFGNLNSYSKSALDALRKQIENYINAHKDLDPENLKVLRERLIELEREANNADKLTPKVKKFIDLFKAKKEEQRGLLSKEQMELASSMANDIDKITGVANASLNLADTLGIKLPEGMDQAIKGFDGISSGFKDIASGNMVSGAIKMIGGAINMFAGLGKTMTSIFGSSNTEWIELNDQYQRLVDVWGELIDRKKEDLSQSWGSETNAIASEIQELYEAQQVMAKTVAEARLKYRLAGDHSVGYNMWNGRKEYEDYAWKGIANDIQNALGITFSNQSDLIKLATMTDEQYEWIMKTYPQYIAMLDEEFKASLDDIHSIGNAIDDLAVQTKEQLTSVAFDTLESDFINSLMDMDLSAEEFAGNFEKYMQQAIMNTLVAEKYRAKLQKWYDTFASDSEDGINADEYKELQQQYSAIVEEAVAERDRLKELMGWASEQEETTSDNSLKGAYASASQESIDLLAGQAGAQRVLMEDIKAQLVPIQEQMQSIYALQQKGWDDVNAIRQLQQQIRQLAEQVAENTYAMNERMGDIKTYSKRSADALESTLNVKVKL